MILNKDVGNSGASLVQFLIAIVVVIGIILVMMQINQKGSMTSHSMQVRADLKIWIEELSTVHIKDEVACMQNFSEEGLNEVSRTDQDTEIKNLYDGRGSVFLTSGDSIIDDNFEVTKIELLTFYSKNNLDKDKFDKNENKGKENNLSGDEGTCALQITTKIKKTVTGEPKVLGSPIQKHLVDFHCRVDLNTEDILSERWQPITSCSPLHSLSNEKSLWTQHLDSQSEVIQWFSFSSLGGVLVGRDTSNSVMNYEAAFNLNLDGLSLESKDFPFKEGIGLKLNSGISFGRSNFLLGAEQNGQDQFMALRLFDGEELHYGMKIHEKYIEFPAFEDDEGTDPNYRGNSVFVRGGVYAKDRIKKNSVGVVGMDHLAQDQILSLGFNSDQRLYANNNLLDSSESASTFGGALWGLRHQGDGAGELYMVHLEKKKTSFVKSDSNQEFNHLHKNSGIRFRHPRNFISSGDYNHICSLDKCSHNWIMGTNLKVLKTKYNFLMGDKITTNGNRYNLLIGRDLKWNTMGNAYSFILSDNLKFLQRESKKMHAHQLVVGDRDELISKGQNGNYIFATGEVRGETWGEYSFLTGFGNQGVESKQHVTALGIDYFYGWKQHSYGDYPLFKVGPQFTLMSGGGLHLQTSYENWTKSTAGKPASLFFGGARHLMKGSTDDFAMIGHNYYRMCDDFKLEKCQYFQMAGEKANYGSSFILLGDQGILFGDIPPQGSKHSERSEQIKHVLPKTLTGFDGSRLSIKGDLSLKQNQIFTKKGWSQKFQQTSDARLKTNRKPISDLELRSLKNMQAKTYWLKHEERKQHGFIAQEVQSKLPSLVFKRKDGLFAVTYNKMYALLIKWFQQLFELFSELAENIDQLAQDITLSKRQLKHDVLESEKMMLELTKVSP